MQASKSVAHVAVKIGEAEMLVEQFAIDVGKAGQSFVEIFLALFWRRYSGLRRASRVAAQVGAVGAVRFSMNRDERFALEDAGVFGEQAKQDADEESFQVVPE